MQHFNENVFVRDNCENVHGESSVVRVEKVADRVEDVVRELEFVFLTVVDSKFHTFGAAALRCLKRNEQCACEAQLDYHHHHHEVYFRQNVHRNNKEDRKEPTHTHTHTQYSICE